jgi:demethylmenaquinone methyltransferase/2-methoxy-6-polyprenyl-1,4-benzoquinol methylase
MYREPEAQNIQKMFSAIAPSYDKANTILSLGIHHLWKQKVVKLSGAKPGDSILDCATGTGDLAILFKEKVGSLGQVIGTDFCEEILALAPAKAELKDLKITFETADVTQLPYADRNFDVASISFGIRNVKNLDKALTELARVTKTTGKVVVLEFGQVRLPVFKNIYNLYSNTILPWIGGKISGSPEAYKYLNDSAARFPSGENFVNRALKTGAYKDMTCKELSFGIAYIYIGTPK